MREPKCLELSSSVGNVKTASVYDFFLSFTEPIIAPNVSKFRLVHVDMYTSVTQKKVQENHSPVPLPLSLRIVVCTIAFDMGI